MNNKINKIKLFFKSKPARIIIALLVIAAIMTGISFAIIALVNALSDPCANQPGKEWNKDLKKCVLNECPDDGHLCLIKGVSKEGNCVPKDYCKEYEGAQYRYDPNTCECTIDCSNDEEMPFTKHGKSFTKFTEDGVPVDPLTCGKSCEYNTTIFNGLPGGYTWCPSEGYWCGQLIYKENEVQNPGQGCWEKSRFHNCSEDIVCPEGVACVSNNEGKPRCMPSLCSGEENNEELVYACLNDDDCINPYKSDKSDINPKCITGKLALNDEDKKFTHFKQVGYCSKTNRFKDNNCTTKRLLGETSASTTDNTPTINICENINSSVEGISTFNPQCDGVAENGCAKFGICPNEWQGKSGPSDNDPHCVNPNESIEEARKEMEYRCCDNPAVTPAGNKFCCPYKTFSDPEFGDQLCTLNTKFGYSKKHLDNTASLSETLSCSVDEDCTKYNKDFYKVLGITQSEAEDKTNNNFSSLYCDKNDNVCKAFCGFYDATSQLEDNLGKIDISTSSDKEQYSFCFPKDSCEIAWQKVTDGIYLPNGYPVCKKTEGQTTTYRWSGNYGDGYTFKSESSLMGDCSDKASINTCMNALGKSNYHINDVSLTTDGKCVFSAACDQLELTTNEGTVSWTSLKEPSWANSNKTEFKGTYTQPGIGLIAQTANSKDPQTGIQNYATASNGRCTGIKNSFEEDITINPFSYVSDVNSCTLNKSYISKLRYNGEYCMNGVDPISPTGACLDKPLDCTKENFGNIDITKNNKKTNNLLSMSSPLALPTNQVFGLVYNQTTDEKKKNMQATIQDSGANNFSCGDMKLNNDGTTQKNLQTELTTTPVNITCKDDECSHGNIKCFDAFGQPTACCGSYDATNPYTINYDSQTEIYSCAGGKGVGYKTQGFPDYNCVLVQDDWKFANSPEGKESCLNTLKPGGYYCNGPDAPGTIMDPFGETNGILNINNVDTGMKGITGCKWTDNAYFNDAAAQTPEWSQDNVSLAQCNILCSSQLEGVRDKNMLDFSTESDYIETGKICGWYPNPSDDGKGLCSIKKDPKVIGNIPEQTSVYRGKLTKCNDIFSSPEEVTPEVCGFNACRGVAGPGYSNENPGAGVSANCIENGGHCKSCDESCSNTNQCGKGNCCQGCGDTNFGVMKPGSKCAGNAPCCGTGYGDGDGVYGCGWCQDGPKCKDNNTYPCYWAPWKDESTRDVKKLWEKANLEITDSYIL